MVQTKHKSMMSGWHCHKVNMYNLLTTSRIIVFLRPGSEHMSIVKAAQGNQLILCQKTGMSDFFSLLWQKINRWFKSAWVSVIHYLIGRGYSGTGLRKLDLSPTFPTLNACYCLSDFNESLVMSRYG